MVFSNAVGQVAVRLPTERAAAKNKFVGTDAKGPPVDGVCVPALCEDFWSHVGHGAGDAGQQTSLGVVDGDVEVGKMGMPVFVEENVIRLDIAEETLSIGPRSEKVQPCTYRWIKPSL